MLIGLQNVLNWNPGWFDEKPDLNLDSLRACWLCGCVSLQRCTAGIYTSAEDITVIECLAETEKLFGCLGKMNYIDTIPQLEDIYGLPSETATVKVANRVTRQYARMIEASPFAVLGTCGPEGLDCSPRGDFPGFVRIQDDTTLLLPDRRGNNRIDSLRNIVRDPRVAILFFIPGHGNTLRVNGQGRVSTDDELLLSFEVEGKTPRSVVEVQVQQVYFQCARAILRSKLWDDDYHVDASQLPTAGEILSQLSDDRVGGQNYDLEWPDRAARTLW